MAEYAITFARPARKELERLSSALVQRIFPRIEALAKEPRPSGCLKLTGEENLWRIRVGDYRVIYTIDDRLRNVDIVAVRHRREAYQ
jgi:mRNA interferase RelE/StbE